MSTVSKEELAKILEDHRTWKSSGGSSGARANLAGANLSGADLAGADLAGVDLAGANLARVDLAGANLARANLAGANLAGADLAGANLAGANLVGAYLARANLADADLADADLARAYLADAYLADAYLARAYLADAYLTRADLADAYLADAYLARANLADARNVPLIQQTDAPVKTREKWEANRATTGAERAKRYRERHPEVPVVENLDARILAVVEAGEGRLEMDMWHTCDTTHCRAGWAIHLAGKSGYDLEKKTGDPAIAGRMIYQASTGRVPHFYATNGNALADLKRCAAEQTKALA